MNRRTLLVVVAIALLGLVSPSCRLIANPALEDLVSTRSVNGVTVERDVLYGTSIGCVIINDVLCGGSQELDVYRSPVESDAPRPLIVWIHGGGWSSGDKSDPIPANVRSQLARGFDVVSLNYRLAPMHRYPAPLLDVKLALRWIAGQAEARGWDPARVFLVGHSAGGHLATLAALTDGVASLEPSLPSLRSTGELRVAGAVSVNGVLDLRDSTRRDPAVALMVTGLIGCGDCGFAEGASPGWWIDRDDPPVYLVAGRNDPLVSTSQAINLCIGATLVGSDCSVDLVDTGPPDALGHFSWAALNQRALEAFLDSPGG